jgi:hypothetical protein
MPGIAPRDHRHFGMFARELKELAHVGHDVLTRKKEVELAVALRVTLQLASEERFHAGKREISLQ